MGKTINRKVATDVDGDRKLDLDPGKVEQTLADLVLLDHALRDEGSSLASVLRQVAAATQGIRI